jgi:hypothetical protein
LIRLATAYRASYMPEDYPYSLSMAGELQTEAGDFICGIPGLRARILESAGRLRMMNQADGVRNVINTG